MVCYAGLRPHERQGMKVLAEERAREGLPLHVVLPQHMRGGAQPVLRSIDTVAQAAESDSENVPSASQPVQPTYEGRGTERTGEQRPYFYRL